MTTQSQSISTSGATITLDQILLAIRQLDAPARARLARALIDSDMDGRLSALIGRLAQREPADDVSDADIMTEIRAVRQERRDAPVLRVVVDTNLWIRVLLGGRVSLPLLEALKRGQFELLVSDPLIDELDKVWRRPRLQARIAAEDALDLVDLLRQLGTWIEVTTVPPQCRDPKDQPVLATAIDGHADAIVTGDNDLRADEVLRAAMMTHGVQLWGLDRLFEHI